MFSTNANVLLCFESLIFVAVDLINTVNGFDTLSRRHFDNQSLVTSERKLLNDNGPHTDRRFIPRISRVIPLQGDAMRARNIFGVQSKLKERTQNYFEPYWIHGNRVFTRTTHGWIVPHKVTDGYGKTITTTTPVPVQFCNFVCAFLFRMYGEVCAKRVIHRPGRMNWNNYYYAMKPHDWELRFKTFDSICEMQLANCNSTTFRPSWTVSYRGPCRDIVKPYPTNAYKITADKEIYHAMGKLLPTTEMSDFVFVKKPK